MNFGRILVLSQNVFREVVRDRILYIIGFYALIVVASMRLLPEFAASTEDKMLLDFALAFMSGLEIIVAIFIGTNLVNKEIEKRTILMLIAKPISQSEFIAGKFLGLSAVLTVLLVAMTAIMLVCLQIAKVSYSIQAISIALIFLLLQLCLIAAIAIVLGVFTSSLLATALTFGIYLMGSITQDLLKFGSMSRNSVIERITQAIYLILPDLSRLDFKNEAVYGLQPLPSSLTLVANAGYAIFYSVMLLALAILLISKREF